MDEQQEILTLRQRVHDIADHVQAVVIKATIIEERHVASKAQMDRIETAVATCNELLRSQNGRIGAVEQVAARLDERTKDAAMSGGKWGAGIGALVSAIIAGLAAAFGGGK